MGCKGCTWLQDGVGGRQGHNEECRNRTETELQKTDDGKERVRRAQHRQDKWTADEIERADLENAPEKHTDTSKAAQGMGKAAGGVVEEVDDEMLDEELEESAIFADGEDNTNSTRVESEVDMEMWGDFDDEPQ